MKVQFYEQELLKYVNKQAKEGLRRVSGHLHAEAENRIPFELKESVNIAANDGEDGVNLSAELTKNIIKIDKKIEDLNGDWWGIPLEGGHYSNIENLKAAKRNEKLYLAEDSGMVQKLVFLLVDDPEKITTTFLQEALEDNQDKLTEIFASGFKQA